MLPPTAPARRNNFLGGAVRPGTAWIFACGLVLFAGTAAAADVSASPDALENVEKISAKDTEAVRQAYLTKAKPVFDRFNGGLPETNSKAWQEMEIAVAEVWAAGGKQSASIIKSLIKEGGSKDGSGRGISPAHSRMMWAARDLWMSDTADHAAVRERVSIAMIDSGTEGSAENDVDKTPRIAARHGDKPSAITEEELNRKLSATFPDVVYRRTGKRLELANVDIELFSGSNFFPRWWDNKPVAVFKAEALRVLRAAQKQEQAYITEGSQKLQVIRRAQEKDMRERPHGGGAVLLVEPEAGGKVSHSRPAEWIDVLGLSGELEEYDAAGVSVGTTLMLYHKLQPDKNGRIDFRLVDERKDDVAKQLMRTLTDTVTVIDSRAGMLPGVLRREAKDYPDEPQRRSLLNRLTGLDPRDPAHADRFAGYLLATEISSDLLKNKELRRDGKPLKEPDAVFEKLAQRLAGTPERYRTDSVRWQQQARAAYGELTAELSMAVTVHNFPTAVQIWMKPSEEILKRGQKLDSGFRNEKVRITAMTLLMAAHDLKHIDVGPNKENLWKKLVRSAPPEFATDLENLDVMLSWGESPPPKKTAPAGAAAEQSSKEETPAKMAETMKKGLQKLLTRFPLKTQDGKLFSLTHDDMYGWAVKRALSHLPADEREGLAHLLAGPEGDQLIFHPKQIGMALVHVVRPSTLLGFAHTWQQSEGMPQAERRRLMEQAVVDELIGQIPYYGASRGLWRSVEAQDTKALVTLITTWLEKRGVGAGIAGPLVAYVDFSKMLVSVVGHEIFHPLRRDYMDIVYKGYLEPSEAGLLRAGRIVPEGFQITAYQPLLSRVPLRYAFLEGELLDQLLAQLDGDPSPRARDAYIALGKEMEGTRSVAPSIFVDLETDWERLAADVRTEIRDLQAVASDPELQAWRNDRFEALARVLPHWERQALMAWALRRLLNGVPNGMRPDPRLQFEVRRQNIHPLFHEQVQTRFSRREQRRDPIEELYENYDAEAERLRLDEYNVRGRTIAEVETRRAALAHEAELLEKRRRDIQATERQVLEQVALDYVEQWTQARGAFKDLDENLALKWVWHDEETRRGIAQRLADDYQTGQRFDIAAQAQQRMLRGMRDFALRKVDEARLNRLAAAADKHLPRMQPADALTFARALGEPSRKPPRIDFKLKLIDSKDAGGTTHSDFQLEARVFAVPARYEGDWSLRPEMRRIDPKSLPATVLGEKSVRIEQIGQAYEVKLDLLVGEPGTQPTVVASAARYLWSLKTKDAPPPREPAPTATTAMPPLKLVNIEGQGADPKTRTGRKHFDTSEASGDIVMRLTLPDTIAAEQPFSTRIEVEITGKLKSTTKPAEIKASIYRAEPVAVQAGPDGRFSVRLSQTESARFQYVGEKPYEWNYLYEATPANGKPHNLVLRYTIGSDRPGGAGLERAGGDAHTPGSIPAFQSARNWLPYDGAISFNGYEQKLSVSAFYDMRGQALAGAGAAPSKSPLPDWVSGGSPSTAAPASGLATAPPATSAAPAISAATTTAAPGAGTGGKPVLPNWLGGPVAQAGGNATIAAASPLTHPDPWSDPQVQRLIDEWLRGAVPPMPANRPGPWRYNEWGQLMGPGVTPAGPPDHPSGWTRHQSMWAVRMKFDSLNMCTMGEYIERRIGGRGMDGCVKPPPPAPASASTSTSASTSATPASSSPPVAAPPQRIERIEVQSAVYGPNCGPGRSTDIANRLAQACNGNQHCDYRVDHHVLGDPAFGCYKDFVFRWRCLGGNDGSLHEGVVRGEASGKTATLACPAPANSTSSDVPVNPPRPAVDKKSENQKK
jgi:hypothetical protein